MSYATQRSGRETIRTYPVPIRAYGAFGVVPPSCPPPNTYNARTSQCACAPGYEPSAPVPDGPVGCAPTKTRMAAQAQQAAAQQAAAQAAAASIPAQTSCPPGMTLAADGTCQAMLTQPLPVPPTPAPVTPAVDPTQFCVTDTLCMNKWLVLGGAAVLGVIVGKLVL